MICFNVTLQQQLEVWAFGMAGLVTDELFRPVGEKFTYPVTFRCPYWGTTPPTEVWVTRHTAPGAELLHFSVEMDTDDPGVSARIRETLEHYSAASGGLEVSDKEREAFWGEIDRILAPIGTSRRDLFRSPPVPVDRSILEALARLHGTSTSPFRYEVFHAVRFVKLSRPDRRWLARWLLDELLKERNPGGPARYTLMNALHDWVVPDQGEELLGLILNPGQGLNRGFLCELLVKARHPRAAETLATLLKEPGLAVWAIDGLGSLRAEAYASEVRRFLDDANPAVAKSARKALKRMGK